MYEVLNAADIHLVEMFMPSGRKQTIHETVSGANDFERPKNNTGKTPLSTGCSNPTYFLGSLHFHPGDNLGTIAT